MTVTFYNVTISLEAPTPRQAYDDFCAHLDLYDREHGGGVIEWETDTYSQDGGEERSTEELWPK